MSSSYLVCQHSVQFVFGQTETFAVSAVHNQNDDLKVPHEYTVITLFHPITALSEHMLSAEGDRTEHICKAIQYKMVM